MRTAIYLIELLVVEVCFPMGFVFSVVFLKRWWHSLRARRAESWPAATGHVFGGSVLPLKSGRRSVIQFYELTVTYNYFAGEYYAGEYYKHFRTEEQADDYLRAIKDKDIQIRYDPKDSRKSCLLDDDLRMIVPMSFAPAPNVSESSSFSIRKAFRHLMRPFFG